MIYRGISVQAPGGIRGLVRTCATPAIRTVDNLVYGLIAFFQSPTIFRPLDNNVNWFLKY